MVLMLNENLFILMILGIAFYHLVKVNAERFFTQLPNYENIQLSENGGDRLKVKSILQCASLCDSFDCKFMKYDDITHVCILHGEIGEVYTPSNNTAGEIFITRESKKCPYSGWEYIWELDSCVRFNTETSDWTSSQQMCGIENGNLMTVSNQLKNELFLPHLHAVYEKTNIKEWWIGANDMLVDGVFRWVSGTNVKYENWQPGQPESSVNGSPDCVIFNLDNNHAFKWDATVCNNVLSSICECKICAA